ncbi:uncharacterized protein EDB91DRAFT_891255 [Suillus paluster]|uniref:uncharacterized protein n=1 Tax=Suillus paluster TaxID=48578 RepID=UPI001B870EBD|nr:uncharacterized protein EDB91DRAFT_891255 [Suillus paluster]KAG1727464.1 hypothetical protein EDB91DRAFT_891255 [Suillus paluster]
MEIHLNFAPSGRAPPFDYLPRQLLMMSTFRVCGIIMQPVLPKVRASKASEQRLYVPTGFKPACYSDFASFPFTNSVMFTSRSIIFALLSFLVGANACIQCPATLKVDGSTSYLDDTSVLNEDVTLCIYHNAKLIGDDSSVGCRYWTVSAFWILCSSLFLVDMLAMASEERPNCRRVSVLSGYSNCEG